MKISPSLLITYIVGFFILYVVCWIFIKPIKWLLKLLLSCICGCLAMAVVNFIFARFGTVFSINPLTAMMSGVLGVPGMIITFILQGIL